MRRLGWHDCHVRGFISHFSDQRIRTQREGHRNDEELCRCPRCVLRHNGCIVDATSGQCDSSKAAPGLPKTSQNIESRFSRTTLLWRTVLRVAMDSSSTGGGPSRDLCTVDWGQKSQTDLTVTGVFSQGPKGRRHFPDVSSNARDLNSWKTLHRRTGSDSLSCGPHPKDAPLPATRNCDERVNAWKG